MYWEKAAKGFLPDIPNPRDVKLKTTPEYQCSTQRRACFSRVRFQVSPCIAIADFTWSSSLHATTFCTILQTGLLFSQPTSLHQLNSAVHQWPNPHGRPCLGELGWRHRPWALQRFCKTENEKEGQKWSSVVRWVWELQQTPFLLLLPTSHRYIQGSETSHCQETCLYLFNLACPKLADMRP